MPIQARFKKKARQRGKSKENGKVFPRPGAAAAAKFVAMQMETNMHRNHDLGVQRLANGLIDYDHYRSIARRSRQTARLQALRVGLRISRRFAGNVMLTITASVVGLAWLWSIAPLGSSGARSKFPPM
jgi:hypothetical protein